MEPYLIADSFVSLAAVLGLLILKATLKSDDNISPLNRRFQFGINVVVIMLVSRMLWWVTNNSIFDTITIIAAGIIPLAVLILYEGLITRHAPKILKLLVAGGAILFAILAFFDPVSVDPGRLLTLLLFQCVVFIYIGYLILSRDKKSLSIAENGTIERLGFSLLLILPLAISDFRTEYFNTPVRLSGIAILFMCWLAISLRRANLRHSEILRSFIIISVSAISAGFTISWLADFNTQASVQVTSIILAAGVLAAIYNEGKTSQRDEERDSLLRYIADTKTSNAASFLQGLQQHSLLDGTLILKDTDLKDFDGSFRECFKDNPIRKLSEIPKSDVSKQDQQLEWFFKKYGATHVMLASHNPFVVVALNMPGLAVSPGAEVELRAVQRMASLLSAREATS